MININDLDDKNQFFFRGQNSIILITCSSFEERCLGLIKLLPCDYDIDKSYIFKYNVENNKRDKNLFEMIKILKKFGETKIITTDESAPIEALNKLYEYIKTYKTKHKDNFTIYLDISTFNKKHLLTILQYLNDLKVWNRLRICYSEPKEYETNLYLPMSTGIKKIKNISTFISKHSPSLKKLLIIFLGYEGDRALTIYENEDPDDVVIIVPDPPYREEWAGKTEEMNSVIITTVGKNKIKYMHSRNPNEVYCKLISLFSEFPLSEWRWSIVPLGTKPQTLGVYNLWQKYPYDFSVIYAQPLLHNYKFYSTGIGETWLLKEANGSA